MRNLLTIALTALLTLAFTAPAIAAEKEASKDKKDKPVTLNHEMKTITGEKVNLAEQYAGKVVMVVNVASECGATPQYADLQKLYEKYKGDGLVILGMPCNQFGGQEPGSEKEIQQFCESKYQVTFPMFAKIEVNGDSRAPLYKVLTSKEHCDDAGDVRWNFEKFLLGRDGKVIARFRTRVNPSDKKVVGAVEKALAEK